VQGEWNSGRRRRGLALAVALAMGAPALASAQVVLPDANCDFDISDDLGRGVSRNTIHLVGRAGQGTGATGFLTGSFYIINGNVPDFDVDRDGFNNPGVCNFTKLTVVLRTELVNQANPVFTIPGTGIIVSQFPRTLASGQRVEVDVRVEIPAGTPAGRYLGQIELRDSVYSIPTARNSPTSDPLAVDVMRIEVEVVPEPRLGLFDPDDPSQLDSLTIRGRAGQRASGVLRIGNLGNVGIGDVRLSATDLRSESAVGLVIPSSRITFSPPSFSGIGLSDTARVTVTVDIPRGILGGRYRGSIVAQGAGTERVEIPLIVIVTSSRGILFANNPVRSVTGDVGQIAFNGDPGTEWKLIIFDMDGMVVYKTEGVVFAGQTLAGAAGTAQNPAPGADFAVNVTWPLINGRGENVASGMYLVVVESFVTDARGVRQRQQARDRLMVIR
jgi:hypothetical protein